MHTSPPEGPLWKDSQVAPRLHFINCHGGPRDWRFYGERYGAQPTAHDSTHLDARRAIAEGSVVAAECCFGAELYDPTDEEPRGICSAYLDLGAYAFMGSSTIAYGPASGNGYADLICQYFVERVLRGASAGRALLEARQRYLQAAAELDEVDLKTLAQFLLLGDPSVHPVARAKHALADSRAFGAALEGRRAQRIVRFGRRAWLMRSARMIEAGVGAVMRRNPFSGGARVKRSLVAAAREERLRGVRLYSYRLRDPIGVEIARELGKRDSAWVHVLTGRRSRRPRRRGAVDSVKIIALVRGGEIMSLRMLEAR
jgi:Peptidase family C25